MMQTDIAKQMINTELVSLLTKANLSKERIPELYQKAEKYADEKKDGNLILKIAEKVEKANNLDVSDNKVRVSESQTTKEFHKYRNESTGKDEVVPVTVKRTVETETSLNSQTQETVSNRETDSEKDSQDVTPQNDTQKDEKTD